MTINQSDPIEVLRAIMEDWPRDYRMGDPLTEIEESLSDQFEKTDLVNSPRGTFSVFSEALVHSSYAKVLVFDTEELEWPNLAILRKDLEGAWKLESFKFQCTSCFGYGSNPTGEPCVSCDLTGWGICPDP
ncbi:MAG: hypothetical protein P1V97_03985 [Planctomycetota bacterium]|nr:hypothetical protein [Planctomycetota bacterium]